MANTFGHVFRRYVGHKLYLTEIAQRKASLVVDDGADADSDPFWTEAMCICARHECDQCQGPDMEDVWYAEEMADAFHQDLIEEGFAFEPAIQRTGKMVAVEWESPQGGRFWVTVDEGALDHEIWSGRRYGYALSDIDTISA